MGQWKNWNFKEELFLKDTYFTSQVKEDLESRLNPIINQVLTKTTNQTLDTSLHITGNHVNITNLETEEVLYTGQVTPNPIKELAIKGTSLILIPSSSKQTIRIFWRTRFIYASLETMHMPRRINFCLNRGARQRSSACGTTAAVRRANL